LWQRGGFQRKIQRFVPKPWKKGQKAWEIAMPASPQLRAAAGLSSARALERREGLIMLAFVNHPELIDELMDELSGLDLTARELDSLRSHILNAAASARGLDTSALKAHLNDRGFGPLLDRLESQATRLSEWYLGPRAAQDDARTGLRQMFALHRKTVTLDRELKAAEAAFGSDPTEENFKTLAGLREQLLSAQGSEAQIEGFGAASGRPVSAIS
jgi:DNA primase